MASSSCSSPTSDHTVAESSSRAIVEKDHALNFSRLVNGFDKTRENMKNAFSTNPRLLSDLTSTITTKIQAALGKQIDANTDIQPRQLKYELEEELLAIHRRHDAPTTITQTVDEANKLHFGQHFGGNGPPPYDADGAISKELGKIRRLRRRFPGSKGTAVKPAVEKSARAPRQKKSKPTAVAVSPRRTRAASRREAAAAVAPAAAAPSPPPSAAAELPPSPSPEATDGLSVLASAAAVVGAAPAGKRKRDDESGASSSKRARTVVPSEGFAEIPSAGTLLHMTTAEVFMAGVEYAVGNAGASTQANDRMRAFVLAKLGEIL
ncbi:unnamed protein product [Periconia digitata]|uniref:Uncharacterized protein n=1 Tax=Periconia digitata TaxID=1303443 RepID=A0A9W4TYX8_9PLEO|nr:unnamed protein product [Periconia digitata]